MSPRRERANMTDGDVWITRYDDVAVPGKPSLPLCSTLPPGDEGDTPPVTNSSLDKPQAYYLGCATGGRL